MAHFWHADQPTGLLAIY